MRWHSLGLLLAAVLAVALVAHGAGATTGVSITSFTDPALSSPYPIAAGPDGALWFGNAANGTIGRITTTGTVSTFSTPGNYGATGIAVGSDGALWTASGSVIGRITTGGAMTIFSDPSFAGLANIAAGPDGALWFTYWGTNPYEPPFQHFIGRITTAGALTIFTDPGISFPGGIVAGPDGALWFTEQGGDQIGRITTDGDITEYPLPTTGSGPADITSGPDGALWFTESGFHGHRIAKITTDGDITEFPELPVGETPIDQIEDGYRPMGIVAGPDGALWFTEGSPYIDVNPGKIGRITTAGEVTSYSDPSIDVPTGITTGPDGAVWFTSYGNNRIGRIAIVPPSGCNAAGRVHGDQHFRLLTGRRNVAVHVEADAVCGLDPGEPWRRSAPGEGQGHRRRRRAADRREASRRPRSGGGVACDLHGCGRCRDRRKLERHAVHRGAPRRRQGQPSRHRPGAVRQLRHRDAERVPGRRPRSPHHAMTRTSTAVLAMVAAAAVLAAGAAGGGTTRDFGDAARDAGGGPDIRRVTIADSGGIVTFTITVTGMKAAPAAGVAEAAFQASLDTNRDGKPDYRLVAGVNAGGRYANVVDVAKRRPVPPSWALDYVRRGDTHTFMVGSSDLGGAKSFDIGVSTATWTPAARAPTPTSTPTRPLVCTGSYRPAAEPAA